MENPVQVINQEIIPRQLKGFVGFSNLPRQVHNKSIKKGFQFTVMVVGESGLGKSTLINTLFNTSIYPNKEPKEPTNETPKTVEIQTITADIEENGVKLKLTIVDTPGFGDYVNNENSWQPILENIEARFDAYLEQENRVNRKRLIDTRVHACIYFIPPTGHSLRPIDIEFMSRLQHRVNLIPVIAKSDILSDDEIKSFKARVLEDIAYHNIQIYQPPIYDNDDAETIQENKDILLSIPFCVVGSDKPFKVGNKITHMEELKEYTNEVLYEKYRSQKLISSEVANSNDTLNPLSQLDEERRKHELKMKKMEAEMKAVFDQKVHEKETKLKQSEDDLIAKYKEMKDKLEMDKINLQERRRQAERGGRPGTPEKKGRKFFK
ncbi:Septin [Neocallimastix californiae]|uniref:Septin n=1 Tax=Neocallimastix californiae TaxID=1754190 RepID=A0A1Y2FMZ3_9FUNG|nr:Septin [Neocallimastix californiae]|eukprot:ORY84596.1 Septin [Neocallimastix californiae]